MGADTERERVDRLRTRATELRLLGYRQIDIAEKLGVTQGRVSQLLAEGRRQWREESARSYEDEVRTALARYEMLLSSLEVGIRVGDPRSVDSAERLVSKISALLGLEHKDRMSERNVRVQEAQVQMLGSAVAVMLDHLGITGDRRLEAVEVLQGELARSEQPD